MIDMEKALDLLARLIMFLVAILLVLALISIPTGFIVFISYLVIK